MLLRGDHRLPGGRNFRSEGRHFRAGSFRVCIVGTTDVGDGFIDLLIIPVRECVRRAMIWIVAIEPTKLGLEFIRFLEV